MNLAVSYHAPIDVDLFVLSERLDLHVGESLSPITDGSVLIHCIITGYFCSPCI